MDGTLVRDGETYAVRFERRLHHPVDRVWRAITDQDELRKWFPDGGVELEFAIGGKVRFAAEGWEDDNELVPREGTVTQLDPPRLLEFTWGDDPLRFELTPEGDGCVLVFSQTFDGKAAAPRLAAGWTICLGNLDALLDGTAAESADFLYLQRETELTKGNLSVNLSKLEEVGYIQIEKTYRGKTPVTLCRLTDGGRNLRQRPRAGLLDVAHQGAADDDAVGHVADHADMLRPADTKADAQGQIGLGPQPGELVGGKVNSSRAFFFNPGNESLANMFLEGFERSRRFDGSANETY